MLQSAVAIRLVLVSICIVFKSDYGLVVDYYAIATPKKKLKFSSFVSFSII